MRRLGRTCCHKNLPQDRARNSEAAVELRPDRSAAMRGGNEAVAISRRATYSRRNCHAMIQQANLSRNNKGQNRDHRTVGKISTAPLARVQSGPAILDNEARIYSPGWREIWDSEKVQLPLTLRYGSIIPDRVYRRPHLLPESLNPAWSKQMLVAPCNCHPARFR